jgi:hypothetical protein
MTQADTLRRLINEERFAEAHDLLAALAERPLDMQELRDVCESLRSALTGTKARRAHYLEELSTLQQQWAYFKTLAANRTPGVDVTG